MPFSVFSLLIFKAIDFALFGGLQFITVPFTFLCAKSHDPHRRDELRQMQTQKMQPAVHKILSHGSKPRRGNTVRRKQNPHFRKALQRLRHLREEMPLQSY
jgi:hypothetical protein